MLEIPDVKIMMVYEQPGSFVALTLTALMGEVKMPIGQLSVKIDVETLDKMIDDFIAYRDAMARGAIATIERN